MPKSNVTIVNATALSTGGALTILRQFIAHAVLTDRRFIIFSPVGVTLQKHSNISYIEVDTKSWLKRIWWDSFGLKRYVKKHHIKIDLCISLQNTTVNIDCAQLVYLHQSLPFSTVRYRLHKETIKYYLYKWFYKFFIFLFSTKTTQFVVQTQWMKLALAGSGVDIRNISVFTPDIKLPDGFQSNSIEAEKTTFGKVTFFYPASSVFYKNHLLILDALNFLKNRELKKNAVFSVTLSEGDYPEFDKRVQRLGLHKNISYLGILSYEKVIENYLLAEAVLFPSYIETFGLPLAEAGVLGKKIICSDLPYSRDVLKGYEGATFLDYQDPKKWADEMESVIEQKTVLSFLPLSFSQCATWQDFFDFI